MKAIKVGQVWEHNGQYCIGRHEYIESGESVGRAMEVHDWLACVGVIHLSDEVVSVQHPYQLETKVVFTRSEFERCFKLTNRGVL